MSAYLTKQDLKEVLSETFQDYPTKQDLRSALDEQGMLLRGEIKNALDTQTEVLQESIRGLNQNLIAGQGKQNERMDGMAQDITVLKTDMSEMKEDISKVKLVLVDYLGTDRALHNLVHELKGHGIPLDDRKVFSL